MKVLSWRKAFRSYEVVTITKEMFLSLSSSLIP
jgi:hypothetical protein